jgi:hypothetical protein
MLCNLAQSARCRVFPRKRGRDPYVRTYGSSNNRDKTPRRVRGEVITYEGALAVSKQRFCKQRFCDCSKMVFRRRVGRKKEK